MSAVTEHEAIVVGSGFSGLCMAIALRRAGIDDVVVLEKGDDVGGTWRDNTYPGIACDIPSHLYSFSFAPNPDWSHTYPPGAEIQRYLRRVAEEHDVLRCVRFGARVDRCVYGDGGWTVHCADGDVRRAPILVSGIGGLHVPKLPAIEGRERFAGPAFHSARWDHGARLRGKRVAVIGAGASAIQIVPAIAPEVERLYVFQRTPSWVVPRGDRAFGPLAKLALRTPLGRLYRWLLYWRAEAAVYGFVREPRLMRVLDRLARRHLARQVADPALRARVTPGYTFGCRRILISDDYYPALCQDHVELIAEGVARMDETSLTTPSGERREVDVVVYATGFEPGALGPLTIVGEGGRTLDDAWREGPEAYMGTMVAGFPNLFFLVGPNIGLGHNSMVFMIEAQVHYVMRCIERMRARGLKRFAVDPVAQRDFNASLQRRLAGTVWASGCASWYLDANGRNGTLWPGSTVSFWARTRRPELAHFEQDVELPRLPERPS